MNKLLQVSFAICHLLASNSLGVIVHAGGGQTALDIGADFGSVVLGVGERADGMLYSAGSAVVLNSEWGILTRHGVEAGGTEDPFVNFHISVGQYGLDTLDDRRPVRDVYRHPGWIPGALGDIDVALFHMPGMLDDLPHATIYTGDLHRGDLLTHVGYGEFSEVGGEPVRDYTRRGVVAPISRFGGFSAVAGYFEPGYVFTVFDEEGHFLDRYHPQGGMVSPGDSGGGTFIATPSGPQLVGINENYWGSLNSYGARSGVLRINDSDPVRDWLRDVSTEHSFDPANIINVPEPSTALFALLGMIGLGFGRKRLA